MEDFLGLSPFIPFLDNKMWRHPSFTKFLPLTKKKILLSLTIVFISAHNCWSFLALLWVTQTQHPKSPFVSNLMAKNPFGIILVPKETGADLCVCFPSVTCRKVAPPVSLTQLGHKPQIWVQSLPNGIIRPRMGVRALCICGWRGWGSKAHSKGVEVTREVLQALKPLSNFNQNSFWKPWVILIKTNFGDAELSVVPGMSPVSLQGHGPRSPCAPRWIPNLGIILEKPCKVIKSNIWPPGQTNVQLLLGHLQGWRFQTPLVSPFQILSMRKFLLEFFTNGFDLQNHLVINPSHLVQTCRVDLSRLHLNH